MFFIYKRFLLQVFSRLRCNVVDFEQLVQGLIRFDDKIVFVGVVDSLYKVRHSSFREGAKLLAKPEVILNFMSLAPRIVVDELEKRKPWLGPIKSVLVRYEKRVFMFVHLEDCVVVIGFQPEVSTPLTSSIVRFIENTATKSTPTLHT